MALEVPPSVVDLLAGIDRDMKPVVEYEVGSSLSNTHRADGLSDDQRKGAWAEMAAFTFTYRHRGDSSVWGTHFGPVFSAAEEDGSPFHAPDITEVDAEIVGHWERRSEEAKHPVLRARYADLVWDLTQRSRGARPDVRFARIAIDSYLDAVEAGLCKEAVHAIHCAQRALALAVGTNDQVRIPRIKAVMFCLFDKVANAKEAGTWPFLFDSLYRNEHVSLSEGKSGGSSTLSRTSWSDPVKAGNRSIHGARRLPQSGWRATTSASIRGKTFTG